LKTYHERKKQLELAAEQNLDPRPILNNFKKQSILLDQDLEKVSDVSSMSKASEEEVKQGYEELVVQPKENNFALEVVGMIGTHQEIFLFERPVKMDSRVSAEEWLR